MGCGERKQDPTATHTLSIFREACFPAVFLALISQHTALKGARLHLLLITTGSIIFSSPLHPSFCTLKPLQVSVWQQGCPHGAQPCPMPWGSAMPGWEANTPLGKLYAPQDASQRPRGLQAAAPALCLPSSLSTPEHMLSFPLRWLQMPKSPWTKACTTANPAAASDGFDSFGNPRKGKGRCRHGTAPALRLLQLAGSPVSDPASEPHAPPQPLSASPSLPSLLSRPC